MRFLGLLLLLLALPTTQVLAQDADVARQVTQIQERLLAGELVYDPRNNLHFAEIFAREWNRGGGTTLVLVHGLGGSHLAWTRTAEELARAGFHVVAYDQRGHGRTPMRGYSFSSTTMAHDLLAVMDGLGIERAGIVGHSMGGRTVMRFAQLFPQRTLGVVVEDMHMLGRTRLIEETSGRVRGHFALARMMDETRHPTLERAKRYFAEIARMPLGFVENSWFVETTDSSGRKYFGLSRQHLGPIIYQSHGLQEDLTLALRSTSAPLAFLKAASGPVLWGKGVDHIKATNVNAAIFEVEGTDHGLHFSAAEQFNWFVSSFFRTGGAFAIPEDKVWPGEPLVHTKEDQFSFDRMFEPVRGTRNRLRALHALADCGAPLLPFPPAARR